MGIYATKSKWQRALRPVVDFCVKRGIQPDAFIYAAILLSIFAGIALWQAGQNAQWLWVVPVFVLLRLGFNLMDGMLARELEIADAWGEVKNEFGDRIADAAVWIGLGFGGYNNLLLLLVAVTLIFFISYLGILGKAVGAGRVYGGIFGKGDRMLALSGFCVYAALTGNLGSFNLYLWLAVGAALVTIVQRLRRIYELAQPPGQP